MLTIIQFFDIYTRVIVQAVKIIKRTGNYIIVQQFPVAVSCIAITVLYFAINYQKFRAIQRIVVAFRVGLNQGGPQACGSVTSLIRVFSAFFNSEANALCVVCLERKKTILVMPCRHLCLCEMCATELKRYQNVCPLCRHEYSNLLVIYL